MLKSTEQHDKLRRAIILSITLHSILITVLILGSIHHPQKSSTTDSGRVAIDAVMVDSGAIVQQNQRQQQAKELQKNQATEQWHLGTQEATEFQYNKQVAKQREVKQQEKTKAKQVSAAAKNTANTSAKAKQAAKDKTTKKQAAKKQTSNVDALLSSLTTNSQDAHKVSRVPTKTEIDDYKAQVSRAISDKFYDASSYNGRTCDLLIKLSPDGLLVSVTAVRGDPALCQAAVSATKLAIIPRPPSPQVYEVFQNAMLGFSPQ